MTRVPDSRAIENGGYGAVAYIDDVLAMTFTYQADEARGRTADNLRAQSREQRNAAALYALSGINAMNIANSNADNLEIGGALGGFGRLLKAGPRDPPIRM